MNGCKTKQKRTAYIICHRFFRFFPHHWMRFVKNKNNNNLLSALFFKLFISPLGQPNDNGFPSSSSMPFVLLQINGEEKKIEERSWMRDQSTKFKRCATPTRIIMGKSNGTPNKQCAITPRGKREQRRKTKIHNNCAILLLSSRRSFLWRAHRQVSICWHTIITPLTYTLRPKHRLVTTFSRVFIPRFRWKAKGSLAWWD